MNHKIRNVDLKPGMFVMVSRWLDEPEEKEYVKRESMFGSSEFEVPKKPIGDALKVLSVALPFFVTEICMTKQRGVLDSRVMELTVVDRNYVKSLCPNYFTKIKRVRNMTDDEKRISEGSAIPVSIYKPGLGWSEILKDKKP